MKKLFIYLLFCLSISTYGQDQLFKKDNSKVDVKILEINQSEIKYKLFTYQDGPTITIAKKEVALIIYQNGVHEVISTTSVEQPPAPAEVPFVVYNSNTYPTQPRLNRDSVEKARIAKLLSTKNFVSFNMLEPINGSIGLSYMREFANNYFNVYVPATVGFAAPYFTQAVTTVFSGNNNYYDYNNNNTVVISDFQYTKKNYEIGLGIHFQSSGKMAVTHFVGPYVGMSKFEGTYTRTESSYDPITYYNTNTTTHNTFTLERINVMLNNGLLFRVTKNFNIMMLIGLGYHIDTYTTTTDITEAVNYNKSTLPLNAFKAGISFGYRF